MKYQTYIKTIVLCLGFISSFAYGQEALVYDMEQIKDVSLLELKVLKEWHPVATVKTP